MTVSRFPGAAIVAAAVTLFLPSLALAQSTTQTLAITGVVKDVTDAFIPGAQVRVVNQEFPAAAGVETVTDVSGAYRVEVPVAGRYRVEITIDGFETFVARDVSIDPGQRT